MNENMYMQYVLRTIYEMYRNYGLGIKYAHTFLYER